MSKDAMTELHQWLIAQSSGLKTYIDFERKSSECAKRDRGNSSIYALLSAAASRFGTRYDGEPLPADAAQAALSRLIEMVGRAAWIRGQPVETRLRFLNDIATCDLSEDIRTEVGSH